MESMRANNVGHFTLDVTWSHAVCWTEEVTIGKASIQPSQQNLSQQMVVSFRSVPWRANEARHAICT
jgi:hypothetical protein